MSLEETGIVEYAGKQILKKAKQAQKRLVTYHRATGSRSDIGQI